MPNIRSWCCHAYVGAAALLACGTQPAQLGAGDESPDSVTALQSQPVADARPSKPSFPASPGGENANGLRLPEGFLDYGLIGVTDRSEDGTVRVLLGNEIAVRAARYNFTHPWPEGSTLVQLVWSRAEDPNSAVVTGDFTRVELMFKDMAAFSGQGGWGYGAWYGPELLPSTDPDFDQWCLSCHALRGGANDYVYTRPVRMPSDAALAAAVPAPNGLEIPQDIRDWSVVGVAHPNDGTMTVVAGNSVAVSAARARQTSPWPDGSMLAQFIWSSVDDAELPGAAISDDFSAFTLMTRPGDDDARDGGWLYGSWSGPQLAAPSDVTFDRRCVNCHTGSASNRDFVFTQPGELPEPPAPGVDP